MAFGPATPLLQQAILTLLQGQNPSPLAPAPLTPTFAGGAPPAPLPDAALPPRPLLGAPSYLGPEYGGPSQVVEPPQAPLDTSILAQILAAQGPAPTAPAPLSGIQRFANALQGFGAGVQGQGPQFLAQLQEPQRRYEQQLQDYNAKQSQLKLVGTEAMLREREGRTRRAQELSDRDFQAEFQRETQRLNLSSDREKELLRDTLLAKRQREDDERQAEENRKKEAQQTKIELAKLASKYRAAGAKGEIATELAQKDLDPNFKLSKAADKWFSARVALEEARAERAARPAGTGAGAAPLVELVDRSGQPLGPPVRYDKLKFNDFGGVQGFPEGTQVRFPQPQAPPAPGAPTPSVPLGLPGEFGAGGFSLPGVAQQQQAAKPGTVFTRAEIEAHAKRTKRDPKAVEADIRARGGIVQ